MSDKASLIKEAQKYLAKGQIDKAITIWEELVKESPGSHTYNALGDLYLKKGDRKKSIDSFYKAANFFKEDGFFLKSLGLYKKILNIDPTDSDALYAIGEINEERGLHTDAVKYYLAAADHFSKSGRKEKLLQMYARIIAVSPTNIPFRNKVAEIYAKEGLRSEAAKEYLNIARLHKEGGDLEKAMEYCQKALVLLPSSKEAFLEISYLVEKKGDFDHAIEQMTEASALFPQDEEIYFRCSEICTNAGKFDEARNFLGKITELQPENLRAKRLLGEVSLKEGNRERAWVEFTPVIEALILSKEYNDAESLIESFKDIDPLVAGKMSVSLSRHQGDNPRIAKELISLGDKYLSRAMQEEALQCYKEALSLSPDDELLKAKVVELEGEVGEEVIEEEGKEEVGEEVEEAIEIINSEKSVDESLVEADIYLKYGLYKEARNLLDELIQNDPENIDLHVKLKSLHVHTDNKEQAVTECLELQELYEKVGDTEKKEQIMREAFEIYPEDPRLSEMVQPLPEPESSPISQEKLTIEDYREEMTEADFYSRQGLQDQAREILEKLQGLFPDNEEIRQKLGSLKEITEGGEKIEIKEKEFLFPESQTSGLPDVHEPALDNDVLTVFDEFKKGLEKEFEEKDYATHYNLGLAYKEIGLLDDAIKEFQISRNDPENFFPSSSMLATCYLEKGLYPLAIDILTDTLERLERKDESYWAMKYDLADTYEKNDNVEEAYGVYKEVYEWNSEYRDVSEKLNQTGEKLAVKLQEDKIRGRKDRISYL